jgi:hypothetical protein
MGNIVLRFADFDENFIDESNTTLELVNLCTKKRPLLENWPLDFKRLIDAKCNEICIITYNILAPILKEYVIHDHIVMFHV